MLEIEDKRVVHKRTSIFSGTERVNLIKNYKRLIIESDTRSITM